MREYAYPALATKIKAPAVNPGRFLIQFKLRNGQPV